MRLASLPWYDLREVHPAHDALWGAVAGRLRARGLTDVPDRLERGLDYASQWRSGRLLLGQACGYDVVTAQRQQLRVVATPHFDVAGCVGPQYRSYVVVHWRSAARRLADVRGARCVINTETSHSGMNALRQLVAPLLAKPGDRFFGSVRVSGGHEHSAEAVTAGEADVAAIDCISYALLARYRPQTVADLRIIARTRLAPAPPFVTSAATPHRQLAALRGALRDVLDNRRADAPWAPLRLRTVEVLPLGAYDSLLRPDVQAGEDARRRPDQGRGRRQIAPARRAS